MPHSPEVARKRTIEHDRHVLDKLIGDVDEALSRRYGECTTIRIVLGRADDFHRSVLHELLKRYEAVGWLGAVDPACVVGEDNVAIILTPAP
jgi:hypothetical protein